ncbi:MAG: ECF-type sigma factor [Planctomycetota bacterium]
MHDPAGRTRATSTPPDLPSVPVSRQELPDWNDDSLRELVPEIYDELRRLAARHLRRERADHTLQTTALAHEAFLRLRTQRRLDVGDRAHFLALAARLIRRILVDHARARRRSGRGDAPPAVALDGAALAAERGFDALELSDLLDRLATVDPLQARVVELRVFAGLSFEEVGRAAGVSTGTAHKEWRMARAWLLVRLERDRR